MFALPPGLDRMDALLAAATRRVVELLFRELEDVSDDDMAAFKAAPSWAGRVAAAQTITREIRGETTARFDPKRAHSVTASVLLVTGENSPDPAKPHAGAVAAALPDARIIVLDGHDHVADAPHPEFFAARVVSFLLGNG